MADTLHLAVTSGTNPALLRQGPVCASLVNTR